MTQEATTQAIAKREAPAVATNNVLAGSEKMNSLAKINMGELRELATILVASKTFKDVTDIAQAQVKILAGAELGFSPLVSICGIHFIQGKVELSAPLKASLIKDSGRYDYKILDHSATRCEIEFFQKRGDKWVSMGVPVVYTYKEAQDAGLLATNQVWKKYPKDMLFNACIRQGVRRYCADVLRGFAGRTVDDEEVEQVDASAIEAAESVADSKVIDVVAQPAKEPAPNNDPDAPVNLNSRDDFDPATIDAEDAAERAAIAEEPAAATEDSLQNLRANFVTLYNEARGEAKARMNDWLGDRRIGALDEAAFKEGLALFGQ